MNDRDLVILAKKSPKYKQDLFFKYEKLAYKHLHILERQVGYYPELAEDFMADTYEEAFLKALDTVKPEGKNEKWLFLGWYGFFLKNLRIRYLKEIFKQRENETSLIKTSDSGTQYIITDVAEITAPDTYSEIDDKLAFESILKELTERQQFIVNSKRLNYKNNEIARKLGVSNTLITMEMKTIKKVFEKNL